MEFDDLIIYILLFAFFVLPSILKTGRKKKTPVGVKKKPTSVLGKLRERIQDFVRELEKQAAAAKLKVKPQGSAWDELADPDGIEPVLSEAALSPASVPEYPDPPLIIPEKKQVPAPEPAGVEGRAIVPDIKADLPAQSLQQAVIWSEILGKPVALRQDIEY